MLRNHQALLNRQTVINPATHQGNQQIQADLHRKPSVSSNTLRKTTALALDNTPLKQVHLLAQLRSSSSGIITECITNSILRHKDQELEVGHRQPELLVDIKVVLGSLVTGTAGAVKGLSRVNARGGDVAAVLAGDRVTGAAFRASWVGEC